MKTLVKTRKYLAILIGAVSLLTVGLIFVLKPPLSAASQSAEDPPSQTTPNESQAQAILLGSEIEKNIDIEFLYLDLTVCGPCQGTEATFDQAVAEVRPILEETGFDITVDKILVENETQARDLAFLSSPTIRVNGRDIQPEIREKTCDSCSGLCGAAGINCRVWMYQNEEFWAPPKSLIIDAILSEAYGGTQEVAQVAPITEDVPDNLKRFFSAQGEFEPANGTTCCPTTSSGCCP